jgi:molybdenum cofactor biosynthesis protein B
VKRAARRSHSGRRPAHARPAERPVGCAIVTVSDTRRGADDVSGARIQRLLERGGHRVVTRAWVADAPAAIRRAARAALARASVEALILTGGTGLAPRDRTPEAMEPLVQRWLPGFGERFRALSEAQVGSAAWLSRAAAGVAAGRLVVLLPGSVAAVELALERLLLPELGHVMRLLKREE